MLLYFFISNILNGTKIVLACQVIEKVLSRFTSAIKSLLSNTNILTTYSKTVGVAHIQTMPMPDPEVTLQVYSLNNFSKQNESPASANEQD